MRASYVVGVEHYASGGGGIRKRVKRAYKAILQSHSRRPHSSPNTKINDEMENLILDLRRSRNLGARQLQSELLRLHNISLSLASIHKVFKKQQLKPVKKFRKKSEFIRYERPIPGGRVKRRDAAF